MTAPDLERERALSEAALLDASYDFTAKYMAVCHLHSLARTDAWVINPGTISTLKKVLADSRISRETQAYFFFREIAGTLCSLIIHSDHLPDHALAALKRLLRTTSGHTHRAIAEALGALPFSVNGPEIAIGAKNGIPLVTWSRLCEEIETVISHTPRLIGRSLVATPDRGNNLLVVKLARAHESVDSFCTEPLWMDYLLSRPSFFTLRFDVPKPIRIRGNHIFKLQDIPLDIPPDLNLHQKGYAFAFTAHKEYFLYPNHPGKEKLLPFKKFREVIFRNAWLLGKLTSLGIIHSAPITLFHNRVQRHRRRDHGFYEWPRAGRLDGWLGSCSYPNMGVTGIRDFEHLIGFKGLSRRLYIHIGAHFLSLLLVAGSYFRNKDRTRIGLDTQGRPVDVRDLFDKPFLIKLIQGIFLGYYHGFVGTEFFGEIPLNLEALGSRMIDEMGVDRHMEEVLRVADQKEMTNETFRHFLESKGYSHEEIKTFKKGAEDITIQSGPHLGGFNERISLPELIESVASMSALSIAGRYLGRKQDN